MNNKSIKIVDEHNIDREGFVIFSFALNGTDYCVYKITRDENNDNLFISKLLREVDGTFKLVNIDDKGVKSELISIVQKMITGAVNSNSDKSLPHLEIDGKNIDLILNVIFNREQNIIVDSCYISTVSKAVTKVSEKYFDVQPVLESQNVSEINTDSIFVQSDTSQVNQPVIEPIQPVVMPIETQSQSLVNNDVVQDTSVPISMGSVEDKTVNEVEPVVNSDLSKEIGQPVMPVLGEKPVDVVLPEIDLGNININNENNNLNQSIVNSVEEMPTDSKSEDLVNPFVSDTVVVPNLAATVQSAVLPESQSVVSPTNNDLLLDPYAHVDQVLTSPNVVSNDAPKTNTSDVLTFDASKESNLMQALGEVSSDNSFAVSDINSVREFGVDEPIASSGIAPMVAPVPEMENKNVKVMTKSKGFVDNKFLMVIAILLFVAACVFLGYEAFKYFNLK